MKCTNCGEEVYKGLNFCPHCGSKVEAAATNTEEVSENNVQESANLENNVQENTSTPEMNSEGNLKGAFEINNNQSNDNNTNPFPEDNNTNVKKDEKTPNIICIASLFFFYFGGRLLIYIPAIGFYLSLASPLVGLYLMVYVRVHYPDNIFGKVLKYLYIISFIISALLILYVIVMCKSIVSGCPG